MTDRSTSESDLLTVATRDAADSQPNFIGVGVNG